MALARSRRTGPTIRTIVAQLFHRLPCLAPSAASPAEAPSPPQSDTVLWGFGHLAALLPLGARKWTSWAVLSSRSVRAWAGRGDTARCLAGPASGPDSGHLAWPRRELLNGQFRRSLSPDILVTKIFYPRSNFSRRGLSNMNSKW